MPSTRDIRRRIKSVKNTAQITKAMQMVAASKMRKAQQAALAGRPYATLMNKVLGEVTGSSGDFNDPLMDKREVKKRCLIVVSTDKGLCGGLNSNLMREAAKFDRNITVYVTAGRKASQFIARTKRELAAEFTYKDAPLFAEARAISKFAQGLFLKGAVDQVDILFTNFISTLNQKAEVIPFLPVAEVKGVGTKVHDEEKLAKSGTEFIFEPSAKASEHSSRMVAMKNATDNAKQILKDLTLEYNKLRQANITKELLEITSAAMAMS